MRPATNPQLVKTGDRVEGQPPDRRYRWHWRARRRCDYLNERRTAREVWVEMFGVPVYRRCFMYRWEARYDGERWAVVAMQNRLEPS